MNYKSIIQNNNLGPIFKLATFGIERESLRTDLSENLALTQQPSVLGKRSHHPYLITDFSESQPELVTPPCQSVEETIDWLKALHDVYKRSMKKGEYLWPFSMPNRLPRDEKVIPIIDVAEQDEIKYREYLSKVYGKKLQMVSGIHFNFSFSDTFLKELFKGQSTTKNYQKFKNQVYLKLTRNFLRYQWILTYLFGATPYADRSFFESDQFPKQVPNQLYRSLRNSDYGYNNDSDIHIDYSSLESYVTSIEKMVDKGAMIEEREFYGNARLRGKGKSVREMLYSGIHYVEFRSIDINPLDELGITSEQIQFIQLFFQTLLWMEEEHSEEDCLKGDSLHVQVASEAPNQPTFLKDEGLRFVHLMDEMASSLNYSQSDLKLISQAMQAFEDPKYTLAAQVADLIGESGERFFEVGRKLGLNYQEKALEKPFLLRGFEEMEMSTQMLLFDAIQRGLEVEILDEKDQFIRLSYQDHQELIKKANMTAKDTLISYWLTANKSVTKALLEEAGYPTPKGGEYQSVDHAIADYQLYANQAIVVKPKSTNYGVGISIFKEAPGFEPYQEAVQIAFKEDSEILIEEYIEGTEYRFFVINGKTEAVLLRMAANVVGDGKQTISQLIDQKNLHPYRGFNHRAPLEKIQKGEIEALMLKEQGYNFDSIPKKDEKVYLRQNSNISTGGDSIDFTDQMHQSYKKQASQMTEDLGLFVTGVDLIIGDHTKASSPEQPGYKVIEANFNPAMHMHTYVQEGQGRRLTQNVIDSLFPELPDRK